MALISRLPWIRPLQQADTSGLEREQILLLSDTNDLFFFGRFQRSVFEAFKMIDTRPLRSHWSVRNNNIYIYIVYLIEASAVPLGTWV